MAKDISTGNVNDEHFERFKVRFRDNGKQVFIGIFFVRDVQIVCNCFKIRESLSIDSLASTRARKMELMRAVVG